MTNGDSITAHYARNDVLARLEAALVDDGQDPARPTLEALAPYDQFHGRGLEATRELADGLEVSPEHHLLDVGSGIGGPARYLAQRFGCRITGIDLTSAFCQAAQSLTERVGLDERVSFEQGDALAMPFGEASFDGAYSMNVSMNIADKAALYREIHRMLRPGAWLVLSELAMGPGGAPDYPTPWALTADSSFLATPEDTRAGLEANGFTIERFRDTREEALAFGAMSRAMVERGEKPPHRAVMLIHGEIAADAMANTGRGLAEERLIPIEIFARKA